MVDIKIYCFGDSKVGKTSIIKRMINDEYTDEYDPINNVYQLISPPITYTIFDSPTFILKVSDETNIIILIYDKIDIESYNNIFIRWLPFVIPTINENDYIYIVGNGVDKENNFIINTDQIPLINYCDVSAKTGFNIENLTVHITATVICHNLQAKTIGTLSLHFTNEYYDMNTELGRQVICSVCLDQISRDNLRLSKCCHIFCKGCIEKLDKCAVCRNEE